MAQAAQPTQLTPDQELFQKYQEQEGQAAQAAAQKEALWQRVEAAQRDQQKQFDAWSKAHPETPVPHWKGVPPASAANVNSFGMMLLGLAMLGFGGNRERYMQAVAAMTGAMQGWNQGRIEAGNKAYKEYQARVNDALMQEREQNDEMRRILMQTNMPISQLMTQLKTAAAGAQRADALAARTFTQAIQVQNQRDMALQRLEQQKMLADEHLGEMKALAKMRTGTPTPLSSDALDLAAWHYKMTGQLPYLGMGSSGANLRAQIIQRAADLSKGEKLSMKDAALGMATSKATASALPQVERTTAMIGSYEQTAQSSIALVRELAQKGSAQSGIPVLNRWIQAGRTAVAGDPNVTAFNNAIVTLKNEYAKIMSGGYGATATSDSARNEATQLISTAQTPEQLEAALQTMQREMEFRMNALQSTLHGMQSQIAGNVAPAAQASAPSSPATPDVIDFSQLRH